MASQGPLSPGTVVNVADVFSNWSNPSNATASDNTYAVVTAGPPGSDSEDKTVQLVIADSVTGDNKVDTPAALGSESYKSYGGSSDLWGLAPTPAEVNASNFGVVFQIRNRSSGGFSDLLKATNFGFSIPSDATIDGIVVEIENKHDNGAGSASVDHIRITVHYTPAPTTSSSTTTTTTTSSSTSTTTTSSSSSTSSSTTVTEYNKMSNTKSTDSIIQTKSHSRRK